MKLSHSIHKGIMETAVGSLVNKFKIKRRRDTLFFDSIVLDYFKLCEKQKYEKEMTELVKTWMIMYGSSLIPSTLKKINPLFFFNRIFKWVWINLGYMTNITLTKKGKKLIIKTIDEQHVNKIGINSLSIGGYQGFLSILFKKDVKYINSKKEGKEVEYIYELTDKEVEIKEHSRKYYLEKNKVLKIKGFTLKDALKMKIFQLKNNTFYFRGKKISPLENTLFHLIANKGILLNEINKISYKYFKEIKIESDTKGKLNLLKTLLQIMGWGVITIKMKTQKEIIIQIKYPPHGFQIEKDNWEFLIRTIQGYLQTINKKFEIEQEKYSDNILTITYKV